MFKVYSTTTCAKCQMVKKFLALKDAAYEEVNLDDAPEERERVVALANGMTSVPVVTKVEDGVEKLVAVGWNPALITQAI